MCTVTFMPLSASDFVLTSNRDESPGRLTIPPKIYEEDGVRLLYPKDDLAGGSWIGVSSRKRMLCVLNGGFTFHERKEEYRMSRGLIMIDLLKSDDIIEEINEFDWSDIEPFTLIIVDWNDGMKLFELVWDGSSAFLSDLDLKPRIWSSSTLYDEFMKAKRKEWFDDFIKRGVVEPKWRQMWNFHCEGGDFNDDYGFIMDRGFVKTTSISQVQKNGNYIELQFFDCLENESTDVELDLSAVTDE